MLAPARFETRHVQAQRAAHQLLGPALRLREHVDAPEQRRDARQQVRQTDVPGEVIVGAQPQAGDDVDLRVARRQHQDRQRRRALAQPAAQLEAAVGLVTEADVDDRHVGQPRSERHLRIAPFPEALDVEALPDQRVAQVLANGGFVLDDGDAATHARNVPQTPRRAGGRSRTVGGMPELRRHRSDSRPAAAVAQARNACCSDTLQQPPEPADMPPDTATDPMPVADAAPRFDWREWLAFAGAVLGTGLFVSLVLGILVLVISTQANAQAVDATSDSASDAAGDAAIARLPAVAST